jgi:hypothetical protein
MRIASLFTGAAGFYTVWANEFDSTVNFAYNIAKKIYDDLSVIPGLIGFYRPIMKYIPTKKVRGNA